jgi:hypothetical protein
MPATASYRRLPGVVGPSRTERSIEGSRVSRAWPALGISPKAGRASRRSCWPNAPRSLQPASSIGCPSPGPSEGGRSSHDPSRYLLLASPTVSTASRRTCAKEHSPPYVYQPLRAVNCALGLTADSRDIRAASLSPCLVRLFILRRSFAATGRGWRHPTFTCRRPAPGRRAGWLEIREARCDRFLARCQQWRRAGDRREAHGRP